MKHFLKIAILSLGLITLSLHGEDSLDESLSRSILQYTERLHQATTDLNATRERIAREKAPQIGKMRLAEARALAAEQEVLRLDTAQAESAEKHHQLIKDAELLYKNLTYLNTLAQDGLKNLGDGLAPGEAQITSEPMQLLEQKLSDPAKNAGGKAALDVAEFMLDRVQLSLGGYAAPGEAMLGTDNTIEKGVFAFMGPETYFRTESGAAGIVTRGREGAPYPLTHRLSTWPAESAAVFFHGKIPSLPSDATAGKALRLSETKGSVWEHVRKGGVVAYAIVAVGLLALILVLQKIRDLQLLAVDAPTAVEKFLRVFAAGGKAEASQKLSTLRATTRELFTIGLEYSESSKVVLEERLQATLLRQRLHYERRLPMLAVVATAAPLMGLLGTVTGMVRTFALITVFGTGNAGKLASGISEVLVATELGLLVAIPALIAHGFLSSRIQKKLSLLERYALEFVTSTRPDRVAEEIVEA